MQTLTWYLCETHSEQKTANPTSTKLLQRFLVDYLALPYKVDTQALETALYTTTLAANEDEDDLKAPTRTRSGRVSILTEDERIEILRLSDIVDDTCWRIWEKKAYLVARSDIEEIYTKIIFPAKELGLPEGLAINFVRLYRVHKDTQRRKANHYGRFNLPIVRYWFMLPGDCIRNCIV